MIGSYTVRQASEILGVPAMDITERIRKGGVKEITVDATEEGFRYLLTRGSIDQLGAAFKTIPEYEKLTAEKKSTKETETRKKTITCAIDGEKLSAQIEKMHLMKSMVSKALGFSDNYINTCCQRSTMPKKSVDELQRIFGIDPKTYVIEEEPKPKAQKQDVQPVVQITAEQIRTAVCNGVVDAVLIIMKDEILTHSITKAITTDEFNKSMNKALFGAMNGIRTLESGKNVNGKFGR